LHHPLHVAITRNLQAQKTGVTVMLEWLLIGVGFTGALTVIHFWRAIKRNLGFVPMMTFHFSPKGGCTEAIVAELKHARREVFVQAYSFTCPEIAKALIEAKQRGAEVVILLDRANEKETYSELKMLEDNGVIPMIDANHAIAHNKIMIIDRRTVITGSFNFTRQAEHENAENLLILHHQPGLVDAYRNNFLAHKQHSQAPGTVKMPVRPPATPGATAAPHEHRRAA
jgi:phosphatidylserine/phosphatidylglycerophosphate/cardiolipin synthase-like enzyme